MRSFFNSEQRCALQDAIDLVELTGTPAGARTRARRRAAAARSRGGNARRWEGAGKALDYKPAAAQATSASKQRR